MQAPSNEEAAVLYEQACDAAQAGAIEEAVGLLGQALRGDPASQLVRSTLDGLGEVWIAQRSKDGDWQGMIAARSKVTELLDG